MAIKECSPASKLKVTARPGAATVCGPQNTKTQHGDNEALRRNPQPARLLENLLGGVVVEDAPAETEASSRPQRAENHARPRKTFGPRGQDETQNETEQMTRIKVCFHINDLGP